MTSGAPSIDAARVELLLNELRLPGVKAIWPKLAAQSDKEGWPAAAFSQLLPSTRQPIVLPSHRATHGGSAFARRQNARHVRLQKRADAVKGTGDGTRRRRRLVEDRRSSVHPSQIHTAHFATPLELKLELKFFLTRIARRWPPEPPRMRGALDIGMLQINRFDHPRCAFAQLLRRQALFFEQTANRRRTDFQRSCSFVQGDLSTLGALALS